MSLKLTIISSLISLSFLTSCKVSNSGKNITCKFHQNYFGIGTLAYYSLGEKVAQRFSVRGGFKLEKLTLEMDVMNSETITLYIYKSDMGQSTPAGGNLIAKSTIVSDLVDNTGKLNSNLIHLF